MSKIEYKVISKILERSNKGLDKYGTSMERNDLSTLEWLIHAQEEAMDMAVYLEKLIDEEKKKECNKDCCCESRIPKWTRTSSLEELKTKTCDGMCLRSPEGRLCDSCE